MKQAGACAWSAGDYTNSLAILHSAARRWVYPEYTSFCGVKTMKKIFDHLGIAVRSNTLPLYLNVLGGTLVDRYTSDTKGVEVHVAVLELGNMQLELLEPTNRESPVARFIRQKGQGVHHVAYQVENLEQAIQ